MNKWFEPKFGKNSVRKYTARHIRTRSIFSSLSVNTILILMNVLLFIVFSILWKYGLASIDAIAIKPSNILQGKYIWTFLTSMFMHGSFVHLLVNMLSMFFVGSLVNKILGAKRFLYFYILSGLFAALFFVLVSYFIQGADFEAYAVGASGALFGLIGLLMILTPNLPVYLMFIPIPIKMKYAAPGMLILLWIVSGLGNIPVGNTAHLGGFIAGLFYGYYLKFRFKNKTKMLNKHFS